MVEGIRQSNMKDALRRQDSVTRALKEITEQEAAGMYVPKVVKELAEAGIALEKYDPNKTGYPEDRNVI